MALTYTGVLACKCPYCGYVNIAKSLRFENQVVTGFTCGREYVGTGCGKTFAVRPVLHADVEVYKITEVK